MIPCNSLNTTDTCCNAAFRKDLGADSLDTYELVYALEEETGVTISDDEANSFETVGDAVKYLMKELN